MNINLLIHAIAQFKADLLAYANKIKLNDDSEWEADAAIITMSDDGTLNFWIHSSFGETDFFHAQLNIKHFQDDRIIEHHLAECKAQMDKDKANES